jgi:hypothetical protein
VAVHARAPEKTRYAGVRTLRFVVTGMRYETLPLPDLNSIANLAR